MNTKQREWTLPSADARAAWQHEIAAAGDSKITATLSERSEELWPRFAAYYQRLRVLPRRLRRALRRKLPVSLAGAALLLALGQGEALAATITVNGTTCTLVDAITSANDNATPGGSSCMAGNDGNAGGDIINLQTDVTLMSVNNTVYGDTGLPVVTSKITITGNGHTISRDGGAPDFRLLAVGATGNLTLDNVTLSGGLYDAGGGVYNYYGTTTITNSTVSGNSAFAGGGVYNHYGTATITDSTLSGNSADFGGGGMVNYDGTTTITNSTLSGNSTNFLGGGVVNVYGTTTITNSILSGNSALIGGGVVNFSGTTTITDSTLSGNSAYYGGGVASGEDTTTITNSTLSGNSAYYGGGGVYNSNGTTTITNSTLSGNSAYYSGGGVANYDGTTTITNSTLSGNSAYYGGGGGAANYDGTTTIANSTLSGNSAYYGGGGVVNYDDTTTITNSTLSGNSAYFGGGVANDGGAPTTIITNSTLTDNSAEYGGGVDNYVGTMTLAGALISGNSAAVAAELHDDATGVTAAKYNVFGHSGIDTATAFDGTFTPGVSDINATSDGGTPTALTDILDTTLAANGGPTLTHALVSGSPAIDAVPLDGGGTGCITTDPDSNPLTADQRSFGRPAGAYCDTGAFEFGAVPRLPDCALLGNQSVNLGNGTVVRQGSAAAKVCSNESMSLGANVQIRDGGNVQQAYEAGASAGQVLFNTGVHVSGDVLANGDVLFGKNNRVGGDAQAGLDLNFRSSGNKVTGECRYGGSLINSGVFGNSCGSETVEPAPPFTAAFALPECAVTANGGLDIAPPANTNQGLLLPGDYGHVRFGNGTTVALNGNYTFKSLAFGYNNRIEISGPSTLQIEQRLTFGDGTQQTLTGGTTAEDIVYLVDAGMTVYSQSVGANTVLYGTICAPQATITLGNGTRFEGAVYADSIRFGYNVNFTASQAPLP